MVQRSDPKIWLTGDFCKPVHHATEIKGIERIGEVEAGSGIIGCNQKIKIDGVWQITRQHFLYNHILRKLNSNSIQIQLYFNSKSIGIEFKLNLSWNQDENK